MSCTNNYCVTKELSQQAFLKRNQRILNKLHILNSKIVETMSNLEMMPTVPVDHKTSTNLEPISTPETISSRTNTSYFNQTVLTALPLLGGDLLAVGGSVYASCLVAGLLGATLPVGLLPFTALIAVAVVFMELRTKTCVKILPKIHMNNPPLEQSVTNGWNTKRDPALQSPLKAINSNYRDTY